LDEFLVSSFYDKDADLDESAYLFCIVNQEGASAGIQQRTAFSDVLGRFTLVDYPVEVIPAEQDGYG
jgi:hypothetical protein